MGAVITGPLAAAAIATVCAQSSLGAKPQTPPMNYTANLLGMKRPLTDAEICILNALFTAHKDAALNNDNISKTVFMNATLGSQSKLQGLCAGLLSTGEKHAPIEFTRRFIFKHELSDLKLLIPSIISKGGMIPGYGNSFYKEGIDPAFENVRNLIVNHSDGGSVLLVAKVLAIQEIIRKEKKGLCLYPNAAMFTALVAEILDLNEGMELILFIMPRVGAWLTIP